MVVRCAWLCFEKYIMLDGGRSQMCRRTDEWTSGSNDEVNICLKEKTVLKDVKQVVIFYMYRFVQRLIVSGFLSNNL